MRSQEETLSRKDVAGPDDRPLTGRERRGDRRFPVNSPATLSVICGGVRSETEVQVIDVSANGLCFVAARQFRSGTGVKLEIDNGVAFGEVRYCESMGGGQFRCGVDIITYR